MDLIVKQNDFLTQFSSANNIADHFNVFAVKPIRNKPDVYQAFARVSKAIRKGFSTFKDRVIVGLSTCKVYDQFHIKRCNICQGFWHYYKNCPTPENHCCAKCSMNHPTRECDSNLEKCTNCVKEGLPIEQCSHRADFINCPTMMKAQEKLRKNLNLKSQPE